MANNTGFVEYMLSELGLGFLYRKGKPKETKETNYSQEWIEIVDIKDGFVCLKDKSLIKLIEVTPISLNLLTEKEIESRVNKFARSLNTINFEFQEMTTYKNVDVGVFLKNIRSSIKKEESDVKKKILREKLKYVTDISLIDEYRENVYFIAIRKNDSSNKSVAQLKEDVQKLKKAFSSIGVHTKELKTENEYEYAYKMYYRKNNLKYLESRIKEGGHNETNLERVGE
jgi:hypothetical protein